MLDEFWKAVYRTRITPDKEIEIQKNLLSYKGAEVFQMGTLSTIVGPAKSKKTFCMSLLIEQMLNKCDNGFESEFTGEVLYFDTEQSDRRVQMVSKRFSKPEVITFIPIRKYSILERYNIIEEGIKRLKPELVIIDGYKELVADINDGVYATKLTNKLLEWTTEYNCHISGILHTNPSSDKPRGALGTELMNKCSSVIKVEARGGQTRVSSMLSRDKELEGFTFTIDSDGNPTLN